jgi:hypothetical protein
LYQNPMSYTGQKHGSMKKGIESLLQIIVSG